MIDEAGPNSVLRVRTYADTQELKVTLIDDTPRAPGTIATMALGQPQGIWITDVLGN